MINPQHHVHGEHCKHSHHEEEPSDGDIIIHGSADFEGMRKAGKLASQLLDYITPFVKAGITTDELNTICHTWTLEHNAIPAPLGYAPFGHIPFPKSICLCLDFMDLMLLFQIRWLHQIILQLENMRA